MNLLDSFGKRGVEYGLLRKKVDIEDTDYLSKYFGVVEFNSKFTPGKNSISFNGSEFLRPGAEILVECLDAESKSLYIELARTQDTIYKETTSFVVSIHIYGDTAGGAGKLILYGTTRSGKFVRWISNITIDKSVNNISKVRFYQKPTLEVIPVQGPVLGINAAASLSKQVVLTGSFHSFAVNPRRDTSRTYINKSTLDIDYRVIHNDHNAGTDPSGSINSRLVGFPITLYVDAIRKPFSYTLIAHPTTASYLVKDVINETTLRLDDAYYVDDVNKSKIIADIAIGRFEVTYPYIGYNTGSTDYLTLGTGDTAAIIYQSYAQIIYRNLKTFTGYVARHKLYRRSLYAAGDFQLIADERLQSKELLEDNLTLNKAFNKMGRFYNQNHIDRYWYTNGIDVSLTHSADRLIDGMRVTANNYNDFNGDVYLITKNDSVRDERNATYFPYNEDQYLITSGSSYDSNFVELKKDVLYLLSADLLVEKKKNNTGAKIGFYFTSSITDARREQNFTSNHGVKIGELTISEPVQEKLYADNDRVSFLYTPKNDMYGTLVVVPQECFVTIADLSFQPYGDDGFSPEILNTKILFPVSTPNESFEIKAELFDVNSNLVYSELRTVAAFDPSGSTLNVYIPGYSNAISYIPGDLKIEGSLDVLQFVRISGSKVLFQDMNPCPLQTTVLGYDPSTGVICYTSKTGGTGNASYDDNYIYVDAPAAQTVRLQNVGVRREDAASTG